MQFANMFMSTGVSMILTQRRWCPIIVFHFGVLRLLSSMKVSHASCFVKKLYRFDRHWVKHGHLLPHDAVLQLRRASHLWARSENLLPV